ncbi:MAG: hypothetical protein JRE23_12250 [Deltaproteobacteria bacterium]|nr:hypothetical protein [Deltaproteobacteria bacterium]
MTDKRARSTNVSSGARKGRADRGTSRRNTTALADPAGYLFLKDQKRHRWPTAWSEDKYAELNKDKKRGTSRGSSIKKIKPMKQGFTILDALVGSCPKALETVLLAASLKLKRVRRYPGYVLIKTYNLKSRPIEII